MQAVTATCLPCQDTATIGASGHIRFYANRYREGYFFSMLKTASLSQDRLFTQNNTSRHQPY